jgi:hypothetical protein
VTLVEVAALNEPQVGEQALPPMTSAHVTPELVESFCTLAFKVTAVAPAAIVVILLAIVTEMGCVPPPPELELEHPGSPARETMISRKQGKEDTLAKVRAHIRMAYPIAEFFRSRTNLQSGNSPACRRTAARMGAHPDELR